MSLTWKISDIAQFFGKLNTISALKKKIMLMLVSPKKCDTLCPIFCWQNYLSCWVNRRLEFHGWKIPEMPEIPHKRLENCEAKIDLARKMGHI